MAGSAIAAAVDEAAAAGGGMEATETGCMVGGGMEATDGLSSKAVDSTDVMLSKVGGGAKAISASGGVGCGGGSG